MILQIDLSSLLCALLSRTDLVDVVLLAQCVEDDVDLVEHVNHLHGCDVDAYLIKLDHVAEQDGDVWEDLRHTGARTVMMMQY